jgi:hypothetical protein
MYAASGFGGKAEVAGNDGQLRWVIAPVGDVKSDKGVMAVGTPFRFTEPCVAADGNPVNHGTDEGVLGCACGVFSYVVKHAIRDHLFTFRYCFILFNSIGHYINVVYVGQVGA